MEIEFKTDQLRRDCCETKRMQRRWGANRSTILRRRLDQIAAADTLTTLKLVHGRTHELQGNRTGMISLDLDKGWRLLIEPANDPRPQKPDGGLDWTLVTAVRVMAVEDTHD